MDGALVLGPLELVLMHAHWNFSARRQAAPFSGPSEVTVGKILSDVASEADDLPDFLKNMTIPIEDLSVQLNCTKGTKESEYVDFSIETKVGPNFHLIFIQLQKPESGGLND
ncbi:MAG: hypothetical protein L6R41_001177 [Letrouitia leprolyta]|nr:MAG: hypothetical protein L6R41_001177 [Letrouitia leprolyta]